ncbi:MAG: mandelate racemase/muconate lactonizing enzyme family protein [Candidatus Hydrogenedentota bacterium]|nr:MAG: mandelate racemase/muconate lactonizing enzyme family protein [Candidatus Hydrogenedentota bacterium]
MNRISGSDQTREARVVRIELTPVFVPFQEVVKQAMQADTGGLGMAIPAEEAWLGGDFVICKLIADDGSVGLGEAFVWLPETGVIPEQLISIIRHALGKYVLGENPFNVERIRYRMDSNVARSEVAKGLLDMACYDLMGRVSGRPASDFMGGRAVNRVPLAALIPLMDADSMVGLARGFRDGGTGTIRCKLGRSISEDVRIMERMREALGEDVRIRVDYNQAYAPAEAVRAIKAIEPFGIDFAEQPVRATDYVGMAQVQKNVDTPLVAHEGCFSLQDIVTLAELGAIGVVGVNSERPGGVTNALRAIAFAEQRGLGVVLHNQPLGIASAMHIHVAAAKHYSLGHATELFGHVMLEDDLISGRIDYSGGAASVPAGPGWGVELDEDALNKYATGPTVEIEVR